MRKSSSIAQWCERINMRPTRLQKGSASCRTFSGWELTTKIHACVEGLGQLAQFILTDGQAHEVTQGQALIEPIQPEAVVADKVYDADAVISCIERKNAKAVIPLKANRKEKRVFDRSQYRNRNVIERFFARFK